MNCFGQSMLSETTVVKSRSGLNLGHFYEEKKKPKKTAIYYSIVDFRTANFRKYLM